MKPVDFLKNFEPEDFPPLVPNLGQEMKFSWFDPQFTKTELKQMEKAGIVNVNWDKEYFQLTLKAAKLRKDAGNEKNY